MSDHGTASISGAYIEFQTAVLKALPRDIDDAVALNWANDGQGLTRFMSGLHRTTSSGMSEILRLISGSETLVIDEADGTELISAAKDIFPGGIDPDFVRWGANEASGPTPVTPVAVYELAQDATFAQMFGSAGNPQSLCLTQSQIVGFIRKYRNWLRTEGYGTFFLFKSKGELFVADVFFYDRDRLYAHVFRFERGRVWYAENRHRLVLPQL